jgi:Flp pilus assembly protein TadG
VQLEVFVFDMRFALRTNRTNRRGSALIELAIVIPVLLLMCCGAMDFARVIYAGIAIASAARAGVQFGAFSPGNAGDIAGMSQAALNDVANQGLNNVTTSARIFCGCNNSTSEVSCTAATCAGKTPSGYVEVTANYTFNTVVNYPGVPQSVVLNRTARMRVQ